MGKILTAGHSIIYIARLALAANPAVLDWTNKTD